MSTVFERFRFHIQANVRHFDWKIRFGEILNRWSQIGRLSQGIQIRA